MYLASVKNWVVFGFVVCELCLFKVGFQKWLLSVNCAPVSVNGYIQLSQIENHANMIKDEL